MQDCDRIALAAEGWMSLERRVQRRAEGEHVGREVRSAAAGNFGREVGRRTGDHSASGHRNVTECAGDAEVGQLRGAVLGQQHVARLDIAVNDPRAVRRAQRCGNLASDRRDLLDAQRGALREHVLQAA